MPVASVVGEPAGDLTAAAVPEAVTSQTRSERVEATIDPHVHGNFTGGGRLAAIRGGDDVHAARGSRPRTLAGESTPRQPEHEHSAHERGRADHPSAR